LEALLSLSLLLFWFIACFIPLFHYHHHLTSPHPFAPRPRTKRDVFDELLHDPSPAERRQLLWLGRLEALLALADADVLLMANSDFSHVAAMLGDGVRLADPRHRVFQRGWIALRPEDGSFDRDRLAAELASRWPAGAGVPR
jgi:hypothetical protein